MGPLLGRALEADRRSKAIVSGVEFREVVDEMANEVVGARRDALLGASSMGQALVGALSYRLPNARMWTPGRAEPVLVVDVVVASVVGLDAVGQYAFRMGATSVAALVVAVLDDDVQSGDAIGPVMSLRRDMSLAA